MRTTLMRFCSTAFVHAVSSKSPMRPMGGAPSLLTRTWTAPSSRTTVSTTRAVSSARRTSACTGTTTPPVSARMRAAASSSAGSRRAVIATRAPSCASVRAIS